MKREIVAFGVIFLFVGLAVLPSMNAIDDPIPDLDCEGYLYWGEVEPSSTVIGDFEVRNIGEPGSELNWKVVSWPEWGNWTLDPEYGFNLLAGDIRVVAVECVVPLERGEYVGEIVVINIDNPDDCCSIECFYDNDAVSVGKTNDFDNVMYQRIVDFAEKHGFQVELSEWGCGCEDEEKLSSIWDFPIICAFLLRFLYRAIFWYQLFSAYVIFSLAYTLGCKWAVPPNSPPDISPVEPLDGETNVLLDLSELRFQISDDDKDRMRYTVTTDPDIGSGNGFFKLDGVYSISVSGLEASTEYHWYVEVTDGEDTSVGHYTFTTAPNAPIVTNPNPYDGERYVPLDTLELSFYLRDFQGDLMDYTVETSPDIGSGSGMNVDEGVYYVPISNLDYSVVYKWFVNVTDGVYQNHVIFSFQTEHKMVFDPFSEGWQYRKKIVIDHNKVVGDLKNFPVVIGTVDSDLRDKAQHDGDDLLFMDGVGGANRLYHEIEYYDASNGKLIAWVNITSLSSSQNTSLYMYYGNPFCYNQQAPEFVWDSHYRAVWHMNDDTSTTIKDSLGVNDGIKTGTDGNMPEESAGKIGNAQDFDGVNIERIVFSHCPYPVNADDDLTVSTWSKTASFSPEKDQRLISTQEGSVGTYYVLNQYGDYGAYAKKMVWQLRSANSNPQDYAVFGEEVSIGDWFYSVGTVDRNSNFARLFMNGNEVGVPCNIATMGTLNNGLDFFAIGADDPDYGWRHPVDGVLDEIRISDIVRSYEWITTEFMNQNNPSGFMSFGVEETA